MNSNNADNQDQKQGPNGQQPQILYPPTTPPKTGYIPAPYPPNGGDNNFAQNPYQPPNQQYYQPYQQPSQVVVANIEDGVSVGMILFITGFCCVISWWVGCCYPPIRTKRDRTWRMLNIVFTVLSLLGVIAYVVIFVLIGVGATRRRSYYYEFN
ncbi:hypothetical protein MP228_001781 [Amoeboaphelidium protococcarum]|nr:hypothetical protein MP228_001781 [Amoeboaphelidium protococcarum]